MSAPVSLRLPAPPKPPKPAQVSSMSVRSHAHALVAGLCEPLVPGNRVDLLQDGPGTYAAMFEASDLPKVRLATRAALQGFYRAEALDR